MPFSVVLSTKWS